MTIKNIKKLTGKKIAILGFGIENEALACFIVKNKIKCQLYILNKTEIEKERLLRLEKISKSADIRFVVGDDYNQGLERYDIISRIAGYPVFEKNIKKALRVGVELVSPTTLFFDLCPSQNIIGVTGTKGKGTTSSLIVTILKAAGKRVFFGGNIGIPMFSFMDKIRKEDYIVLELSSFQLEDLQKSPRIAVVTNFAKDHLKSADPWNPNHHKSMKSYWLAKENIYSHQKRSDYLVINEKLAKKATTAPGKIFYFGKSSLRSSLVGEHNKENIAAAEVAAKLCGVSDSVISKAVGRFNGLIYRIQHIRSFNGIDFYNDSFATTPDATITALRSFDRPIILLAGGADKGSSFAAMAREIRKRVKYLILFGGEGSARLEREVLDSGFPAGNIKRAKSMSEAMSIAKKQMRSGDGVLLSTGCASFGSFKNYKERGKMFSEEALKIGN